MDPVALVDRIHPTSSTGDLDRAHSSSAAGRHRWPAALSGASAIRSVVRPGWRGHDDLGPIELAVARNRTLVAHNRCRLRHLTQFEARVQWSTSPPRVRLEDAILQVAADQKSEWHAIGVLTDACASRRTTAARLLAATDALTRVRRRQFLHEVLVDLDSGACSVLEQGSDWSSGHTCCRKPSGR